VLLLILPVALGCGSGDNHKPVFPVQGEAFQGSKPVAGAVVAFHPVGGDADAPRPYGTVDDNGKFQLTTYQPNDGAPVGEYVVTVLWLDAPKASAIGGSESKAAGVDRLRNAYSDPKTSKLRATVKSDASNPVRLDVK
jgi:hypothetical protein